MYEGGVAEAARDFSSAVFDDLRRSITETRARYEKRFISAFPDGRKVTRSDQNFFRFKAGLGRHARFFGMLCE